RSPESFEDILAQFVTDPIFIPHGIAQQPLHPIRPRFSCLFSQLPAIFACHVTENALQIQESTMAGRRHEQTRGQCVRADDVTPWPNVARRWEPFPTQTM